MLEACATLSSAMHFYYNTLSKHFPRDGTSTFLGCSCIVTESRSRNVILPDDDAKAMHIVSLEIPRQHEAKAYGIDDALWKTYFTRKVCSHDATTDSRDVTSLARCCVL